MDHMRDLLGMGADYFLSVYSITVQPIKLLDQKCFHAPGSSVTLVDTVAYAGLTANQDPMNYEEPSWIKQVDSQSECFSETTFTAEAADGSTTVTFTFDTGILRSALIVFETLYDTNGNQIVDHSDLNDEDRRVVPVPARRITSVTGDDSRSDTRMREVGLYAYFLPVICNHESCIS